MTPALRTIIVPVTDLSGAKAVYGALLGAEPSMDAPYYVQFDVDGQEVGLDPNGAAQGLTGPVGYWHVDDIGTTLQALTDAGARELQRVRDVGGGKLIATVADADGNPIGLMQQP
jgi:predicted enzyme related to lactoylglutathione lyase